MDCKRAMDSKGDVVAVFPHVDIDFDDVGFGFDSDFDFDLDADEFRGGGDGGYSVPADDKKSAVDGCFGLDSGSPERDSSSREGSPDSEVTDGPLASGDGWVSGYVTDLERFLMEDDDEDKVVVAPDGDWTMEVDAAADEFWADFFANCSTAAAATETAGDGAAAAEDDDLNAPEDEATSRKRTRRQRWGTACMMAGEELKVTRGHLHWTGVPAPWLHCRLPLLCP